MSKLQKRFTWLWPCLLMATLTFASNFQVQPQIPDVDWITPDKTAHFALYGLLATLFLRTFAQAGSTLRLRAYPLAFLCTVAFGLSDEVFQSFNPFRTFSIADLVADAAGALVALAAYHYLAFYRKLLEWRLVPTRRSNPISAQ